MSIISKRIFIVGLIIILFFGVFYVIDTARYYNRAVKASRMKKNFNLAKVLREKSAPFELIADFSQILEEAQESTERYLEMIRDEYFIEALIVTVPTAGKGRTINDLAVEVFENWQIGRDYNGRGLLLLLVNDTKQVKLEVSKELEDVFTDSFTGFVEDLQLRSYYHADQLDIGLVALMEEMEQRAQLKHRGGYKADDIVRLDQEFLSQGAGASRDLKKFKEESIVKSAGDYPAGRTPQEAWQTMIRSWKNKVRDPNLGVYTQTTRLAYRDYQNLPDSRYEKDYRTYSNKSFEVIENGRYAVIFFGKKDGWENSPFLFANTEEGWQFDIAHQRKYIRMGRAPKWGIERADYPYISLLKRCPYFMGQDIPLEYEDTFRMKDEGRMVERIKQLERQLKQAPHDFNILLELGRLYTIVSLGQKGIPTLKKAKKLNPDHPLPYKYLSILNVDMYYQYESAINELRTFTKLKPKDVFGYKYLGYLYYETRRYDKAVSQLKKAKELNSTDIYTLCKLIRSYAQLNKNAMATDPRKLIYNSAVKKHLRDAERIAGEEHYRIVWLKSWLVNKMKFKAEELIGS